MFKREKNIHQKNHIPKKFRHYSQVFSSLVLSFLSILFLPVVVAILLGAYALNMASLKTENTYQTIMDQMVSEIDTMISDALKLNYRLANDTSFLSYAVGNQRSNYTEYEINCSLSNFQIGYDMVENCYIYFPNFDRVVSSSTSTYSEKYFKENYSGSIYDWYASLDLTTGLTKITSQKVQGRDSADDILLVRRITANNGVDCPTVAVTHLNNAYFRDRLTRYTPSPETSLVVYGSMGAIVNTAGSYQSILIDSVKEQKDTLKIEGGKYRIFSAVSPVFHCSVVYAVPLKLINASGNFVWKYSILLIGFCLIVTFLLCKFLVQKNYRPVRKICALIGKDMDEYLSNEYELIEDTLHIYIEEKKMLTKTSARYSMALKEFYLEKLLLSHIPYTASILASCDLYGIHFTHSSYLLVLFQPTTDSVLFKDDNLNEKEQIELTQLIIRNVVTELISVVCTVYIAEVNGFQVAICNFPADQADSVLLQLRNLTQKAADTINEHFFIEIIPYFSKIQNDIAQLSTAYLDIQSLVSRAEKEHNTEISGKVYPSCVEHCLTLIKDHYSDCNLSLSIISDELNLNSSYVSRYFKQQTGIGLLDYLQRYRLTVAKALMLEHPDMVLKLVAEQTGFYNASALIRVFKKLEGMTPGQYKNTGSESDT